MAYVKQVCNTFCHDPFAERNLPNINTCKVKRRDNTQLYRYQHGQNVNKAFGIIININVADKDSPLKVGAYMLLLFLT